MSVDPALAPCHPLNRAWSFMRFWLVGMMFLMTITAITAKPLLLTGTARPMPYIVLGIAALVWFLHPRSARTTAVCTAIIFVGLVGRGVEILLFSDAVFSDRLTPAALWAFVGATTLGLGLSISIVITKRYAEIEVWG